jgi:subtilisin family serine protease
MGSLVPAASATPAPGAAGRGFEAVARAAGADGTVRAIVELSVGTVPEGRLAAAAAERQREAIGRAGASVASALRGTPHRVTRTYTTVPALALELSEAAVAALSRSPAVESIAEDVPRPPILAESSPLVHAPAAWEAGLDGTDQAIAILDTGVDAEHPFLGGRVIAEACFALGEDFDGPAGDCPNGQDRQEGPSSGAPCTGAVEGCKHGTHVAGDAAGRSAGAAGPGRDAPIIAIQVFSEFTGTDCAGVGEDPCTLAYDADWIAGLDWLYRHRDDRPTAAANMSLGGGEYATHCDTIDAGARAAKDAIDNLRSTGIATVVASGNSGSATGIAAP